MANKEKKMTVVEKNGASGFFFFLTYIGAAIYFVDKSSGFGEFIVALLQAAVWPAYLVNYLFTMWQIT